MKTPREFYIPKGARKVAAKDGCATFYLYENKGRPCAVAFVGKAQKPSWRFWFRSEAARAERIAETIANAQAHKAQVAERRAKNNAPHKWEVGLILSSSWGYEQTNVNFFEVVAVVGKCFVDVEEIGSQVATDAHEGYSSMSSKVVPDPEARTGKITRCKVSRGSIKSPVYGYASPWDGLPKYCSWYA